MKPKPRSSIDCAIRSGRQIEVEAERFEHVRGAGLGGGGAVAVLGDPNARSGRDERGCG